MCDDSSIDNLQLGEKLYLKYRPQFHISESIKCDMSTTSAAEYLSYIAFPSMTDKEDRERFIRACDWMALKSNPKIPWKDAKKLVKVLPDYNYRNANQIINRAINNTMKAMIAWHANSHRMANNISLETAYQEVITAYSSMYDAAADVSAPRFYDSDSKDIFQPYRGVLHLVDGLHKALVVKMEKNKFHIKTAVINPFWVLEAIQYADIFLKKELQEYELIRNKTISSKSRYLFPVGRVVDIRIERN